MKSNLISMDSVELLSFSLGKASDDVIREIISVIDQKSGELFDEAEQLEKLDVVVELDPEQKARARYLDEMLDVMTSLMNCCYDVVNHKRQSNALKKCLNSLYGDAAAELHPEMFGGDAS